MNQLTRLTRHVTAESPPATLTLTTLDVQELLHDIEVVTQREQLEKVKQARTILVHQLGADHAHLPLAMLAQSIVGEVIKARRSMFQCTAETGRDHSDGI